MSTELGRRSTSRPAPGGVLREGLLYGVASVVALAIDVGVLFGLVRLGAPPAPASAIGYAAGLGAHYLIAIRLVFAHRRFRTSIGVELGLYAVTGVAGLAITVAIVAAGGWLGLPLIVAKGIAVLVAFISIYLLRRMLMFSARDRGVERGDV